MANFLFNCKGVKSLEFLKNDQLFLGFCSLPFLNLKTNFSSLSTFFKLDSLDNFWYDFFLFTFAYRSGNTNKVTPKEVPTNRSHLDQASGKSYA